MSSPGRKVVKTLSQAAGKGSRGSRALRSAVGRWDLAVRDATADGAACGGAYHNQSDWLIAMERRQKHADQAFRAALSRVPSGSGSERGRRTKKVLPADEDSSRLTEPA